MRWSPFSLTSTQEKRNPRAGSPQLVALDSVVMRSPGAAASGDRRTSTPTHWCARAADAPPSSRTIATAPIHIDPCSLFIRNMSVLLSEECEVGYIELLL